MPQKDVIMRQQWLRLCLSAALCSVFAVVGCSSDAPPPPPGDAGGEGGTLDGSVLDGSSDMSMPPAVCGNSELESGEICDDGNTVDGDGCRGDCGSDYACGNGVLDTIASGATVDEVCDDANTVNGDGCDAACASDESCGNDIVDLGAGEVCDDGNTADGDSCSADCSMSLLCGNGVMDAGEECDDSNMVSGDGCSATCLDERCGNGRLDAAEVCDDGNADDTDGCRLDCTFTCSADADCADADVCNGGELCTGGGSVASRCGAGTPPADGTSCGGANICNGGACIAAACGDGFTSAGEACDDGNTVNGDGCDSDCTFTCSGDADCTDGNACNGVEVCSNAGTLTSACSTGTVPADGTSCGGTNICRGGACVAGACGDSIVSGTEQCDDGANANNNDGCRSDCTFTCTAANAATNCDDANTCTSNTCTGTGAASRCSNPVVMGACTLPAGGAGTCNAAGACVASAACGNGTREGTEACDDGNANNNDGCRSDCTFTCTAANAATNCNDANACTSNTCTGTGAASRCSNPTVANGTMCGGANICVTGACVAPRCGDSVRTGAEACDDGANANNNDGCRSDCTFTCTAANAATNCDDANACTSNTCTGTGAASRCSNPNVASGTTCGGGNICVTGSCVAARCGDLIITAPEVCDDGNTVATDGCNNSCQYTCSAAADCADTNTCNGAETCTMPSTTGSRCVAGTPPAVGTVCDADGMAATRDICRAGAACTRSTCGDGFTDPGATPVETCDDSNIVSGDGCSSVCATESATPPTGFRITNLDLISPRVVANALGCRDLTQTAFFGFSVNGELDTAITTNYTLHIVDLFRPYNTVAASTPMELQLNAACMAAPTPDSCGPAAMPDTVPSTANNQAAGTCFVPTASEVNGVRGAAVVTYAPTANTVSAPCFSSTDTTLNVTVAGIVIPLQQARVSATYSGAAPNRRLVSGVVKGFLSSTAAADVVLPASLPVVGGQRLYSILQAAGVAVNDSTGTSRAAGCNVGGGGAEDDRDVVGGVTGFWFFMNFTADEITWTGP